MLVKVQKSPDLELHVGLTIQCRENDNFGVVLWCVNSEDMRRKSAYGTPVLYYFSKDAKKTIPSLTLQYLSLLESLRNMRLLM